MQGHTETRLLKVRFFHPVYAHLKVPCPLSGVRWESDGVDTKYFATFRSPDTNPSHCWQQQRGNNNSS